LKIMKRVLAFLTAAIAFWAGAPAAAQSAPPAALLDKVVQCKGVTDDQARLRCFDAAAAALESARSSGALVVVDREDVRKTRRSLFGFSVPKLPFFSGDNSQDEEQKEVLAQIKSARSLGYGKWQLDLDSAGIWQTTEPSAYSGTPKPGDAVKIRKAALGSYFITVGSGRAVKGLRVR
jgi:hypothetical protein